MENTKLVKKVKFTDYLSILFQWKRIIIINLFLIVVFTTIFSFTIPVKYRAVSTVMVSDEGNNVSSFGGMLSNFGSLLGGGLLGGTDATIDKLFSYVESRTVMQKVVEKFDLVEYYEVSEYKRDKTLRALREDAIFDITENGLIEITMIHKSPQLSADIANYFVFLLDSLNNFYIKDYATKFREFVEKRYYKNLRDISKAEEDLENFQSKFGIFAVPEQFEVAFQTIAKLEGELAIKELELNFIAETKGKNDPNYTILKNQVSLFQKKVNDLVSGKITTDVSLVYLKLKDIPKIQKEYFKIYRELEVQTKLLEFTLPIYEQSLMEEQKNIPKLKVIDKAIPPQLKHSPKKASIILGVFFMFLFLHIILVFRLNSILIVKNRDEYNQIEAYEEKIYNIIKKSYRIK